MRLDTYYAAAPEIECRDIDYLVSELLQYPELFLYLRDEPSKAESQEILNAIQRLNAGVPAQYILGYAYFFGMQLKVNPGVLIPRFDTENLSAAFSDYLKPNDKVLEIGCGSGAIAISLKCEMPSLELYATDISAMALKVARDNALKHKAQIHFYRADLFPPIDTKYNAIISNPPYISEKEYASLSPQIRDYEPPGALLAGIDGLDYYRRILERAANYLTDDGILAFEHGYNQQEALERLTENTGYKTLQKGKDLQYLPRFLILKKRGNNG
ncbi:MAG: peptide chain release factor N(5)-glutamine methyltransferase [Candidatus Cloacimonadaceae bacterium]